MSSRRQFKKRAGARISAVQLKLETEGFSYTKWGSTQRCKQGDWLVDNEGEVYTVDQDVFARTYQEVGPGRFEKVAVVWAEIAESDGAISTKEGETHYRKGDYLIDNDGDGQDSYAVSRDKFEEMYEEA